MCATTAHTAQKRGMGIVSHIIRYCFNPCGTGSHLYTANANTLRSVHRNKDLLALVGTHTRGRLALPFCTLIVSQLGRFVKGFFKKSLKKFVGCLTERGSGFLHPLDTNSIPQTTLKVKYFFKNICARADVRQWRTPLFTKSH